MSVYNLQVTAFSFYLYNPFPNSFETAFMGPITKLSIDLLYVHKGSVCVMISATQRSDHRCLLAKQHSDLHSNRKIKYAKNTPEQLF